MYNTDDDDWYFFYHGGGSFNTGSGRTIGVAKGATPDELVSLSGSVEHDGRISQNALIIRDIDGWKMIFQHGFADTDGLWYATSTGGLAPEDWTVQGQFTVDHQPSLRSWAVVNHPDGSVEWRLFASRDGEAGVWIAMTQPSDNLTSVDLTASSTQVGNGETVTLSWNSSNTNSCEASGGWSGSRAISGSETSPPITTTTNFILNCTGDTGSSSDSVTVGIEDVGGAISLGSGVIINNAVVYDMTYGDDWSIQTNLQLADTMYGDRSYTFSEIPANLIGQEWLSTVNDSRSFVAENIADFSVAVDAEVFILHRDDITGKPDWLLGWSDTNNDVINSEPRTYSVYSRSFNTGEEVSLGINGSTASGMYVVVVVAIQTSDLVFTNGFE
ncbi:MAG: hypothetical protein L3J79_10485 [Candidatus Marinimicrobia bacterium]|nr:hypothetical protein [Candidatus Neomarinimicrobiota bacterium]